MKARVTVVARPAVAHGFALAGVPTIPVEGAAAATRLEQLMGDPGAGVLLVEEPLWRALPDAVRNSARRPLPLVVPFPGPAWVPAPDAALGYVAEILRQAIGYRVRLQ
jgi:vacuolar-type H+-ATPase subunit F/Vma7